MSETGQYLFAVTRQMPPDALDSVRGFHGEDVRILACGDLQAVVCAVDLTEFGEGALRGNLEDLRWRLKMVAAQLDGTEGALEHWIDASYTSWSRFYDDEPDEL